MIGPKIWLNSGCLGASAVKGSKFDVRDARESLRVSYRVCSQWVAQWCEVEIDRVLLTTGATDACDVALTSRVGTPSVLIHTDLVHESIKQSVFCAADFMSALSGIQVEVTEIAMRDLFYGEPGNFVDGLIARLSQLSGGQRAVFVVEHVSSDEGFRLPIDEFVDRVSTELPNVQLIIDGAQAVGIWRPPAGFQGAYIGCFHKYLDGPVGTGFCVLPPGNSGVALHRIRSSQSWRIPEHGEFLPTTDIGKWDECRRSIELFSRGDSLEQRIEKVINLRDRVLASSPTIMLGCQQSIDESFLSHIIPLQVVSIAAYDKLTADGFGVKSLQQGIRITLHHLTAARELTVFLKRLGRIEAEDLEAGYQPWFDMPVGA